MGLTGFGTLITRHMHLLDYRQRYLEPTKEDGDVGWSLQLPQQPPLESPQQLKNISDGSP